MNARTGVTLVLVALVATALSARPEPAYAQSKTGTTVGTFLTVEPDARIAGMGNAGTSLGDGIEAYYFNPASLARLSGRSAILSHVAWIAGIQFDHVVVGVPLGHLGTGAVSITSLRSGDIAVRTVNQPLGTGEFYSVGDMAIGVGLARPVTDRFSVGGRIDVLQERIWNSTMATAVVDLGALYKVTDAGLMMGASLSNLGVGGRFSGDNLRVTYDEDPSRNGDNGALPATVFTDQFGTPILMRFGAALPWKIDASNHLLFVADALHPNDKSESVSLGAEYGFKSLFALRAGWQRLGQQDAEGGLTLGAGVRGEMNNALAFRFDYAYSDQGRLNQAHRFTVGVDF
jgi:hypothetical protein